MGQSLSVHLVSIILIVWIVIGLIAWPRGDLKAGEREKYAKNFGVIEWRGRLCTAGVTFTYMTLIDATVLISNLEYRQPCISGYDCLDTGYALEP